MKRLLENNYFLRIVKIYFAIIAIVVLFQNTLHIIESLLEYMDNNDYGYFFLLSLSLDIFYSMILLFVLYIFFLRIIKHQVYLFMFICLSFYLFNLSLKTLIRDKCGYVYYIPVTKNIFYLLDNMTITNINDCGNNSHLNKHNLEQDKNKVYITANTKYTLDGEWQGVENTNETFKFHNDSIFEHYEGDEINYSGKFYLDSLINCCDQQEFNKEFIYLKLIPRETKPYCFKIHVIGNKTLALKTCSNEFIHFQR